MIARALRASRVLAAGVLATAIAVSCARTDGAPATLDALTIHSCAVDLDCGPGRHCSDASTCAIDCVKSGDCVTALADPSAPNDLECSLCGRCVAKGVRDSRCLSATDQPCSTTNDCRAALGDAYQCAGDGFCARTCTDDAACHDVGRGWGCGTKGMCIRSCFRDQDCWFHGWSYACALPAGVDPIANADSAMPVYGECKKGSSPFKAKAASDPPSARYQGTWAWIATSAVRVDNVPIVVRLNSVNVQHLLTKVTWDGANIAITLKWCTGAVKNFNENDTPPFNLFSVVVPDRNVDSILVATLHVPGVPALAHGATFVTSKLLDLRGARGLANPETDPLPSYKDLTNQWDQDRDGNPGMTANVTGALGGDIYQSQRWVAIINATVVDDDHLQGLIVGPSAATVLGATTKELINDAVTTAHPDASRSYFRAVRLDDGASCNDVITLASTMGTWIAFTPHLDPAQGAQ